MRLHVLPSRCHQWLSHICSSYRICTGPPLTETAFQDDSLRQRSELERVVVQIVCKLRNDLRKLCGQPMAAMVMSEYLRACISESTSFICHHALTKHYLLIGLYLCCSTIMRALPPG